MANANLERNLSELLKRLVERSSRKPRVRYQSFLYQAGSWKRARRVAFPMGRGQMGRLSGLF